MQHVTTPRKHHYILPALDADLDWLKPHSFGTSTIHAQSSTQIMCNTLSVRPKWAKKSGEIIPLSSKQPGALTFHESCRFAHPDKRILLQLQIRLDFLPHCPCLSWSCLCCVLYRCEFGQEIYCCGKCVQCGGISTFTRWIINNPWELLATEARFLKC